MISENYIGILGDKYFIIRKKGGGGFSQVFLVRNKNTEKEYVAKILTSNNDYYYEREKDMNTLIKNYQIPNIVNFIEAGKALLVIEGKETKENVYYFIFDYYSKGDLLKFVESSGGLPEEISKIIFKKLLESIQKIHSIGIIHFDIKLQNILFDDDFNPYLGDFGLSKFIKDSKNGIFEGNFGTRDFKPPQMFLDRSFNGVKADIFSLGATLFNLVLGSTIFKFESKFNKMNKTLRKQVKEEDKLNELLKDEFYNLIKKNKIEDFWKAVSLKYNPVISEAFKKLIIRMVAFDEDDRPKNIQEILDDEWFQDINELTENLKDNYIKEMQKLEEKKNLIFNPTENVKPKTGKDNRIKESKFDISFKDDMIPKCIKGDLKFDNFIRIKGHLDPLSFMNYLLKEVALLYDKSEIGEKEKNLKFKILIKARKEEENEESDDDEEIIELEKDLTIQIELLKVNGEEYLLNFIKEKGELSDFYHYIKEIMNYAKKYI